LYFGGGGLAQAASGAAAGQVARLRADLRVEAVGGQPLVQLVLEARRQGAGVDG
jgi:hypothetical protein